MAGVTNQGFLTKTFDELFNELGQREKETIDPELDVTTQSVAGQFNAIMARQLALLWEAQQLIYNGFNPMSAEGIQLDNICKITGINRANATYATANVDVTFSLPNTLIETGTFYCSSPDAPTVRFTPVTNIASPSSGTFPLTISVPMRSENRGVQLISTSANITVINTPTFGVNSVSSTNIDFVGSDEETDIQLRNRRMESLAISGSGTIDAIRADVATLGPNLFAQNSGYVKSVSVFEATSAPTAFVEEAHAIKVVIDDTGSVPAWDDLIAETIFYSKPAGISTVGNYSGTVTDATGTNHIVKFQRVIPTVLTLTYTITYRNEIPDEAALKEYIANTGNAKYQVGEDVIFKFVESIPFDYSDDIVDITACTVQGGTSNIVIDFSHIANFDKDQISITFVQSPE